MVLGEDCNKVVNVYRKKKKKKKNLFSPLDC